MAGAAGDAGKTLLSVALILLARQRGTRVRAFKKGPDYIDAAWLGWAAASKARNIDTFLMGFGGAAGVFAAHAIPDGLNLIEGNRGLYDGLDAKGSHSTAELAKLLKAPVVLVLKASKVTRSAAAWVLGCQKLDQDVHIAGVVLNHVATQRHEQILRQAIEEVCGIPVLGSIPRIRGVDLLPSRHLGLITPEEHSGCQDLTRRLLSIFEGKIDIAKMTELANGSSPMLIPSPEVGATTEGSGLKVGYVRDSAFTFYYPDNLEALEAGGVTLVPISSLSASGLPADLDALYIGGGFPETHAAAISSNRSFLEALREAALRGLPIYAECGGLMLLARAIHWRGVLYAMAGLFPLNVEVCDTPQGHGYEILTVDTANAFFPKGLVLKGHEFHYSRIVPQASAPSTACRVVRGTGAYEGRDGVIAGNVWASYVHLHAVASPEWSRGLIGAARRYRKARQERS